MIRILLDGHEGGRRPLDARRGSPRRPIALQTPLRRWLRCTDARAFGRAASISCCQAGSGGWGAATLSTRTAAVMRSSMFLYACSVVFSRRRAVRGRVLLGTCWLDEPIPMDVGDGVKHCDEKLLRAWKNQSG